MSVQLEVMAGEVFEAAGVLQRAGAVITRRPFGEVVANPDYPEVFFLNFLAGLDAPDWTPPDLEAALVAEIPGLRYYRASSRNRATCERLDPRLQAAGYQPEHKLGMVLVREPALRGPQVRIEPAASPGMWPKAERLFRSEWEGWPAATVDQVARLNRWWERRLPVRTFLASVDDRAVGRVGVLQHRSWAHVHALWVEPAYRGRGVATTLMLRAAAEARVAGCDRVSLLCLTSSWLPAYYRRLGYVAVGEEFTWMKAR